MSKPYLVVANQKTAKFFHTDGRLRRLTRKMTLENPFGTHKNQDLVTDRPGMAFDSGGQGQRAMQPPQSALEKETERFAKEIAHQLDAFRSKAGLENATLVAEPKLLGLIRNNLSKETEKLIKESIALDIAHLKDEDIQEHVIKASDKVLP